MRPTSAERWPRVAWLGLLAAEAIAIVALALSSTTGGDPTAAEVGLATARDLTLTDLALWSEAGYCRHPSQVDRFSPWATHPAALDHFPAGSFVSAAGGRDP